MSIRKYYFGAYCEQCEIWMLKSDGTLLFYPSVALMEHHLKEVGKFSVGGHRWAVEEFKSTFSRYRRKQQNCPIKIENQSV